MTEFVARPSVAKLILLLLLAVGFVAAGLWMAGLGGVAPKPGKEWVGWLSIIFFGACGVAIFFRLFDRDDQIRISSIGVYSKQWSPQTVPWSEIVNITIWEYKRLKSIILHLRDPSRFPSTTWQGKLAFGNRALTGGDIALNLTGTDRSVDEAMQAIDRFRSSNGGR
jgi:hypothetical protein